MSKKLIYLMSFVLVLAVTGTATAAQWDITVPDANFDDYHVSPHSYIDIVAIDYAVLEAWKCQNGDAWIGHDSYWDDPEGPDLPALSGNNILYGSEDLVYQILDETFIEGGTYTLSVWVGLAWSGYSRAWALHFTGEDYTNNLIQTSDLAPVGSWQQVSLAYTATAADVGKKVGIKIYGALYVSLENVTLSYDGPHGPPLASNPDPDDGDPHDDDSVVLSWDAAAPAVWHDVYFGTNFDAVNDANENDPCGPDKVYRARQTDTSYAIQDELDPNETYKTYYYWRIDEVNDADSNSPWKGFVWSFWLPPWEAHDPFPPYGAMYMDPNTKLYWSAGFGAGMHEVFFGTAPGSLTQIYKNWDPNCAPPGPLDKDKTYYWQVKEWGQPKSRKTLGPIWSFTTSPPTMGTILYEYWDGITPTGNSLSLLYNWPDFPGNPTGTQILTLFEGPTNRANQFGARIQAWLYAPVTGDYKFWIATDDNGELWLSTDDNPANKQLISTCGLAGSGWAGPQNWTDPDVTPSGLIHLEAGQKYYIEALMKEGGGGDNIAVGWTTPWDDTIQVIPGGYLEPFAQLWAWDPSPADGAPEVPEPITLRWRAGSHASQHKVYFGTSEASMTLQDTLPLGTEEYDPPGILDLGQTYYWKVNEVNVAGPDPCMWEGDVWSFTTLEYLVVDDMEDYNDRVSIETNWRDGYACVIWGDPPDYPLLQGGCSGSVVDVASGVGGGTKAMVFNYDNDGNTLLPGYPTWPYPAPYFSEIEANTVENLHFSQNWVEGTKVLSLGYQGHAESSGSYEYFIQPGNPTQYDANDIYRLSNRGRDISGTHDEFYYVHVYPVHEYYYTDTLEIVAKVIDVCDTDVGAKAGVMIRDKLTPYSQHAFVGVTPGQGVSFQRRLNAGGESAETTQGGFTAPHWVKLVMAPYGTSAYHANDVSGAPGLWTQIGATETIAMDPNVYIGLAVTSHNANAICTADFNGVAIWADYAPGAAWGWGDIGTNDAEQLYVALSDGTTTAVVNHPDPNAATLTDWKEWNIPLTYFTGVDMNSVKKVYIGFGDRDSHPTAGGSGIVYIDDISLYPSRCALSLRSPDFARVDFVEDCVIDHEEVKVIAENWLAAEPIMVVPIPIDNAGFEAATLADGDWNYAHQGWGYLANAGELGSWNPGLFGSENPGYGGNAPEGQNIVWTNPGGVGVPGGFAQVLTDADATLKADTTYKLTVEVGRSLGYPWGGYSVQLLAGGTPGDTGEITVGTLLAEDSNSLTIARDTFETSTVTYTYNPALHSGLLGEPLQIRLLSLGNVAAGDYTEAEFDDVKLFRSIKLYEDMEINFKDFAQVAAKWLVEDMVD